MVPSAAVENETSGARLAPAIFQLSLPRVTTTSAAMRSAAAFAASAEAAGTAGVNDTTGTAILIDAGGPGGARRQRHDRHGHLDRRRGAERRELLVERAQQGRLVHGSTVLRRGDAERP